MKIYLLSAILKKNLPLSFNIEHKISLRFYKMYNLEHKCCGCLLRFPHGNDVRFLLPPVICRSAHVLFTLFVFVCGVQRMFNMMLCCGFFLHLVCRGPGGSMRQVVGSNNSYKPITNTAWVRARLCKLQTRAPPTGAGCSTFSYLTLNCKQFTK